jgi:hypothetical protein
MQVPQHIEPYFLQSGPHDGLGAEERVAFEDVIRVEHAAWLQIRFGDCSLGARSSVVLTSLHDGARQIHTSSSLEGWQGWSAYFNGDAVQVELLVAPQDRGVFLSIEEIKVGEWMGERDDCSDLGLCGGDDRVSSNDRAVGRLMMIGGYGTAWIAANGALLTAGHNAAHSPSNIEFNVPPSLCDGTIVHPGPEDQYPVLGSSFVSGPSDSSGNDWAVFTCSPVEPHPVFSQGAFHRLTKDDIPTDLRVTGHGCDDTPPGCGPGTLNSDSGTQQTSTGGFLGEAGGGSNVRIEFTVDITQGVSGSPVINTANGAAIGIANIVLDPGGCQPPSQGNRGVSFECDDLETAVQTFFGPNIKYVDKDHHIIMPDGTIFRPYHTVAAGISAAPVGGEVGIVAGSYDEPMTITKNVTLSAPVGNVTIGE